MQLQGSRPLADRQIPVRESFLIGMYRVPLLLALVVAVDVLLLNGKIKAFLPNRPEEIIGWTLVFGVPHVIASFVPLISQQSMKQHGRGLLLRALMAVLIMISLNLAFGPWMFLAVYIIWEIAHAADQQFGLAKNFSNAPENLFPYWRVAGVIVSIFINTRINLGNPKDPIIQHLTEIICIIAIIVFFVTTALWAWRRKIKPGANFLFANLFVLTSCLIFYSIDYAFFSIAIGRIVHDVTANYFYYIHEANRTSANGFLKSWSAPIRTFYLPVIAIGIAALITYENPLTPVMFWVGNALALMHYMNETYVWKYGSVLRSYTPLARAR